MVEVKSIKIDGESIHVFDSAIYIFESSSGTTLELDMIVSEIVVKKFRKELNLIIEIELEDGRIISSIMNLKVLSGGLPQLNLFCELDESEDYYDFDRINENDSEFPKMDKGITLEEIRSVEMPNEEIKLKLKLPIDQTEWLLKQKKDDLNEIFKQFIYDYWTNKSK